MRKDPTLDPLVDVLALYAATRNYGYVDRLGNALDKITAYEAIRDVLRDFYSQCVDRREKCVDNIKCPEVSPEALEEAVNKFVEEIMDKSGDVIVEKTRELVLAALARKPKLMKNVCEVEAGASKGK